MLSTLFGEGHSGTLHDGGRFTGDGQVRNVIMQRNAWVHARPAHARAPLDSIVLAVDIGSPLRYSRSTQHLELTGQPTQLFYMIRPSAAT